MRSPTVKDDWVVEHRLSRLVSSELLSSDTPGHNYNIPPGAGPQQLARLGHGEQRGGGGGGGQQTPALRQDGAQRAAQPAAGDAGTQGPYS